jgi:hypothetical protein
MLKNCQISKWLNMSYALTIKFRGWLLTTTHIENNDALLLSLSTHRNEMTRKRKPYQIAWSILDTTLQIFSHSRTVNC